MRLWDCERVINSWLYFLYFCIKNIISIIFIYEITNLPSGRIFPQSEGHNLHPHFQSHCRENFTSILIPTKIPTFGSASTDISNGKAGRPAPARPNLPKARQKRGGAGRAKLGRQVQYFSPPRLRASWRVGGLAR